MIIVLKHGTEAGDVAEVAAEAERAGLTCRVLTASDRPVLHVVRGETRRARRLLANEHVQALVATSGPRVRHEGRRFFPYHVLNWCSATLLLLAAIVLLAGQLPPGLGPAPDPRAPSPPLVLPWWIAWAARAFAGRPAWLAPLLFAGAFLLLLLLPTLDRLATRRREGGR
jgi:DAHP synthetase family protein